MSAIAKFLVFVDLPGGELDETGRGLLSWGGRLAGFLDAAWGVVTPGVPMAATLEGFAAYGTPAVTRVTGGEELLDTPAILGKTLARLVADESAQLLVLPHNDLGAT
ncbi:MAG TPA: electron transfer flavoprotein subunit alpha/FixB family protein, partial [Geobacteraceae bacterium]